MAENPSYMSPHGEEPRCGANQASTITATDIEKAYVYQDRWARRRINLIGQMSRQFIRELTVYVPASQP